ncbi:MAG TPA: YggT family protein [Gammaproteobacteria bacterium]
MDNQYLGEAAVFLIQTVFGLFLILVMLRLLLQLVRGDFYNPISQFIVKTTNWALKPLRRIIPGLGGIDLASIVLMLGVQMLVLFLIAMARGFSVHFSGLTVLSIAELMALLLNVYMMTIIAQAILSWVGPGSHNPLSSLLYSLNEPVLRPFRRLIPAISGIDLAPLAALIVIQFTKILIVGPITSIGNSLS